MEKKEYALSDPPFAARSWGPPFGQPLMVFDGVVLYKGEQCLFQPQPIETNKGAGYFKKPADWLTNCFGVCIGLVKFCKGGRNHAFHHQGIARGALRRLAKAVRSNRRASVCYVDQVGIAVVLSEEKALHPFRESFLHGNVGHMAFHLLTISWHTNRSIPVAQPANPVNPKHGFMAIEKRGEVR